MFKKRILGFSMAGLFILVVMLFTISAPVRANVVSWIRQIAGFNVAESTESPLANVTEEPSMVTELTPVPVTKIADAPFAFAMPQYLPNGFELSQDYTVAQSKQWVLLSWVNQPNYNINLLVEIHNNALIIPAHKESTSKVTVNGQPALLIRGGWVSETEWNENKGLELQWLIGGLRYDLQYNKRGAHNEIVPFDDTEIDSRLNELTQIAESIH